VSYAGEFGVDIPGRQARTIDGTGVAGIVKAADDIGFFAMDGNHLENCMDLPKTTISIRTGDRSKRVSSSYGECSRDADTSRVGLARLAERIDSVAGIARWIKSDNQSLTDAIKSGLDVNSQSSSGETPLIVAIRQKMVPRVLLLLDARAKVDLADAQGVTPLMWATMTQQPLVVRELLRRGADATAKNANVFRAAQLTGDPEILALLPSGR